MNEKGEWETFLTSTLTRTTEPEAQTTVTPFLMFTGQAEAATAFAAPRYFHQVHVTKFGLAGQNDRSGGVGIEVANPLAFYRMKVGDWRVGWNVDARDLSQGRKQALALLADALL